MFNIVEKRRWYFIFSAILLALSIGTMVISTRQFGQPMRLGIDFTGGGLFFVQFKSGKPVGFKKRDFSRVV